jgi:DNA-directed RNA polymerase specialized sigma24 family protein
LGILERQKTKNTRKVSRKAVLKVFLETRNFRTTAAHFGVAPATINSIVYVAFRTARRLAGLKPLAADE